MVSLKKRLLVILMTIAMVVNLFPQDAYAVNAVSRENNTATSSASDGETTVPETAAAVSEETGVPDTLPAESSPEDSAEAVSEEGEDRSAVPAQEADTVEAAPSDDAEPAADPEEPSAEPVKESSPAAVPEEPAVDTEAVAEPAAAQTEEVTEPVPDEPEETAEPVSDEQEEVAEPAAAQTEETAEPVSDEQEEAAEPAAAQTEETAAPVSDEPEEAAEPAAAQTEKAVEPAPGQTEAAEPAAAAEPEKPAETLPAEDNAQKNQDAALEEEPAQPEKAETVIPAADLDPSEIHDKMKEQADEWYGDGGTYNPKISVSITPSTGNVLQAGSVLVYTVAYTFKHAENWEEGYSGQTAFYDYYGVYDEANPDSPDNHPNTVTVHLPAGLLLTGSGLPGEIAAEPDNRDTSVEHTYTLPFPKRVEAAAMHSTFTLTIYVGNNGTEDSINTYTFPDDMVTFSTTFEVLDKQDPKNYTTVELYTHTVAAHPGPITTSSPDKWGVKKNGVESLTKYNASDNTVTFTWDVEVGMLEDGEIKTLNADYSRVGRNLLQTFSLKDTFATSIDKDSVTVGAPQSVTITKSTGATTWGTPKTFESGDEIVVWGTGADEDLLLNYEKLIDLDGDSTNPPEQDTPKYTKYRVEATYQVSNDWIAHFPRTESYNLKQENKVESTANLAKVPEPQKDSSEAEQTVPLPVDGAARLLLDKKFANYQGDVSGYTPALEALYGALNYTISADSAFTVYEKTGNAITPIDGMSGDSTYQLVTGKEYYLLPGIEYTVKENLTPQQQTAMVQTDDPKDFVKTPAVDEKWDVTFHNRETVGSILVTKQDDAGRKLTGVGFTLYDSTGTEVVAAEKLTSGQGTVSFARIPYGDYILKETKKLDGYVPSADIPVTIDEDHTQITVTAVNKVSSSRLILTKYVGLAEGTITHKANASYPATFELQRTTNYDPANPGATTAEDWEPVDGVPSAVSPQGQITATLDAFDNGGNPYWYRFEETIPEGYYDPATGRTDKSYTDPVKLTEVKNGVEYARPLTDPVKVSMYNRKFVRVHVAKSFYAVNNDGTLSESSLFTTTVRLFSYTKTDYSDWAEHTGATPDNIIGNNASGTDYADWLDLPLYGPDGRIHYVIQEGPVKYNDSTDETFILDTSKTGNVVYIDADQDGTEERYIDVSTMTTAFTDAMYGEQDQTPMEKVLYNVQNLYPVQIWKRNYYTNAGVDGSGVTVYNSDLSIATGYVVSGDVKVETSLSDVPVKTGSDYYVTIFLEPGQTYTFDETVNNTGLHFHSLSDGGKITLPSAAQSYANKDVAKNLVRTIYNAPDPLVRIRKVDSTSSSKTLTAEFTAYQLNADNKFEPVLDDQGNPVVINSSNTDQTYRFVPGDYYFAETLVPDGYLDPNKALAQYQQLSADYIPGETVDGQTLTFVKGEVKNMTKNGTSDNIWTFTFRNIPNKGKLKVLKYVDGKLTNIQPGFKITVTGDDGSTAELVTDKNGQVVFELPVYKDDCTTEIEYTVSEELSESQMKTYTKNSDDQTATLTLNQTTDKDKLGEPLIVQNITKISYTADKVFRKTWEYNFTNHSEPQAGATIGLFEKNGDDWVLVDAATLNETENPQLTDDLGEVHFDGLTRGVDYALVELDSGDPAKFPYKNGFLELPSGGAATETIPDADLSRYNVLRISGEETLSRLDRKSFPASGTATMVNQDHWVQFDITKWLDPVTGRILGADEFGNGKAHNPHNSQEGFTEVDNVVFDVYRFVMPDGQTEVTFPGEGWTNLGTYTTGTLYIDDVRQMGQFITVPDQGISGSYVYLIREKNVGPNSIIPNPNFTYTFWTAEGKDYSVTVPAAQGTVRHLNYKFDRVNFDDILDYRETSPGPSVIYYLASLRLTKWRDSYDEQGNLTNNYQPLPDATFELVTADGTVLDTITVGLDDKLSTGQSPRANAQSCTFQLVITTDGATGETVYSIRDFETEETLANVSVEPFTFEYNGVTFSGYRLPIKIRETVVPDEFAPAVEELDTYLCFADVTKNHDGQSWVFNDAYFVKTSGTGTSEVLASDQHATSWFITNASGGSNIYPVSTGDTDNPSPIRIVNYPTTNAMVHIVKYGYTPTPDSLNKTGAELDSFTDNEISRTPLSGVNMVIEKKDKDGRYKPYNYLKNEIGTLAQARFKTKGDGSFLFPKGLSDGDYQIYEENLGSNSGYEMTYPKARPRQFTVLKALVDLSLYNPTQLGLRLEKEGLDGTQLDNTDFTIHYAQGSIPGNTHGGNYVVFSPIPAGKYWITESRAGYSSEYLKQYLKGEYDLTGFTKSPGVDIGYHFQKKTGTNGNVDYVIDEVYPGTALLSGPAQLKLTIQNPKTGKVKLLKVDHDGEVPVGGAKFIGYYRPFDGMTGTTDLTGKALATRDNLEAALFELKDELAGVTDNDGLLPSLTGKELDPGIYAFIEDEAPDGYDVRVTKTGGEIIYFVVVKGDLDVTVTGIPASVEAFDGEVDTLFEGTTEEVEFTVRNYQKITLKAKKEVYSGALTLTDSDSWSVTLNLYADKTKSKKVGTVTITNTTNQGSGLTFKDPADASADALFSLGTTYYLEEVVSTPKSNLVLHEVLRNGVKVTDLENGMYLFPVETLDSFTITAKNDWMFGRIVFGKVDVSNYEYLSGAEFEVQYKNTDGKWVKVPGSSVTEQMSGGKGTGLYTAWVPLVSADSTEYHIVETAAPIDYLLPKDFVLSVSMSLQDNDKSAGLMIPNTRGNHLTIYKNSNIYGSPNGSLAADRTAEFSVYHETEGGWELVAKELISGGKVTYLAVPGDNYAVVESYFDSGVFNAIDGVYQGDTKLESSKISTVDGAKLDAYLVTPSEQDITINVYNIPYVTPVIRKIDVGRYQGGAEYPKNDVKAQMEFAIYEVSASDRLPAQPTRAQVEAFLENHTSVFTGTTQTYSTTDPYYVANGTTTLWKSEETAQRWNPKNTYLLVETNVSAKDGAVYDTLRRDDPDVEWFKVIQPVVNPDKDRPPVWELKNVYGDADVKLEKAVVEGSAGDPENDVVDGAVGSLLEKDRKIVFTLSPSVSGQNQMLESFILKDTGVRAFAGSAEFAAFEYTFDKIIIGGAGQKVDACYGVAEDAVISAVITFKDGAEETAAVLGTADVADVNKADPITEIPAGTRAFEISYFCNDLLTATGTLCDKPYALGEQFTVQPATVYVTAKRQQDGTADAPADEITRITNGSHVDLNYWKWTSAGVMPDTPEHREADAEASVKVNSLILPKVAIEKRVPSPSVALKQTVTYTIEVKNLASSPTVFDNPIVLDILPTAVTYVNGSAPSLVTATGGEELLMSVQLIEGAATHTTQSGVDVSEFEKAILFKMSGTLGVGSTAVFTYQIKVPENADLFTKILQNDAYLSSSERTYHTRSNPQGCPFVSDAEEYGKSLDNAAFALGGTAPLRESGMKDALDREGGYATGDYRWLAVEVHQNINEMTTVTVNKAVWGDRDVQGFHDTGLGVASRTNGRFDTKGWVRWRLSMENGYTDRDYIDHLVIGDVIARPGDGSQRNSHWMINMYDNSVLAVLNNEVEVDPAKYDLYYYTGSTAEAESALVSAMKDGDLTGWKTASEIASVANWTEATAHLKTNEVTAFIVVFDEDVRIYKNTSMILVYETKVVDIQDDDDFVKVSFTNDSDYFYFDYYDPTLDDVLRSNTVNVTLIDRPVEIQGDVWIDEDQDGIQEATNRRDYSKYTIITALADSISFSITDMREATHTTTGLDTGDMSQWNGGESIKHFRFDGLGAAMTKNNRYPYVSDGKGSMILNPVTLKGDDPYHYVLNAVLKDNTENGDILTVFKLSQLGEGHYVSDDPDASGFSGSDNFLDNNFFEKGTRGTVQYETYPFYVMYSNNVDQSKDIGFKCYRSLEIEKVAQDDEDLKIAGAKFQVFGPYADSTLADQSDHTPASGEPLKFSGADGVYTLDADGTVTDLVTNEKGRILISGLNWWKEYDVREIEAGPGYEIEKAVAEAYGSEYTVIEDRGDGVFTLRVPAEKKAAPVDQVRVKDPRYAEIELQAEKMLETYSEKEYTFEFEERLISVTPETTSALNAELMIEDPIETISITVKGDQETGSGSNTGKFAPVKVNGAGTYTFTIRELVPEVLPDGWTYDLTLEKTAVVTVGWDGDKLVVEDIVYSEPHTIDGETYLQFTNQYETRGEWTPELSKSLVGRPIVEGEFTFTVTEGEKVVSTGTVKADGKIDFEPVTYKSLKEAGTHVYTITEDAGDLPGITYAGPVTATVVIEDAGGKLEATSVSYEPENVFVNTFHAKGSWSPTVYKILNGRDMNEGEVFRVSVTDADGREVMAGTVEAGTDGEPVSFSFDPVKLLYTEADVVDFQPTVYTYTVTETIGDEKGIIYDSKSYKVNVTVALHVNEDGSYSELLDVTDDLSEEGLTIINKYEAFPAEAVLRAEKQMTGDPISEGTSFTFVFTMTAEEVTEDGSFLTDDPAEAVAAGDTWKKEITVDRDSTTKGVDFDGFTYTRAGTYVYRITEEKYDSELIVCDTAEWTCTVVVVDDLHGTLIVTETYESDGTTGDAAVFVNDFRIKPVQWQPGVKKVLDQDSDRTQEDAAFRFEMTLVNADPEDGCSLDETLEVSAELPAGAAESETVWFDQITFTSAGTYTFEVKELDDGVKGFSYDTAAKTVTVKVANNGGILAVDEVTIDGGEADISGAVITVKVTNTFTGDRTSVSGVKTWKDRDNAGGLRPVSITVRLYADGKEVDSKVVTAEDGWKYTFDSLPRFNGEDEIVYTVKEDVVKGYVTTIDGYDIINTLEEEKTSVSGTKTWKDKNDADKLRPVSITIRLYADGKEVASKVVTKEDDWKFTFEDLPKYNGEKEIVYTITEDIVMGYTTTIKGYDVINTRSVPGTGDSSDLRPWMITMFASAAALAAGVFFAVRRRRED